MNCKPGDLAIKFRGRRIGALVRVMYAAPARDFVLPDGAEHWGQEPGRWVCESLGPLFSVGVASAPLAQATGQVECRYACIRDDTLRPIRGEPEPETRDERITEKA